MYAIICTTKLMELFKMCPFYRPFYFDFTQSMWIAQFVAHSCHWIDKFRQLRSSQWMFRSRNSEMHQNLSPHDVYLDKFNWSRIDICLVMLLPANEKRFSCVIVVRSNQNCCAVHFSFLFTRFPFATNQYLRSFGKCGNIEKKCTIDCRFALCLRFPILSLLS